MKPEKFAGIQPRDKRQSVPDIESVLTLPPPRLTLYGARRHFALHAMQDKCRVTLISDESTSFLTVSLERQAQPDVTASVVR